MLQMSSRGARRLSVWSVWCGVGRRQRLSRASSFTSSSATCVSNPSCIQRLRRYRCCSSSSTTTTSAAQILAGLQDSQRKQLRDYLDYLLEINKAMNLTAVRDPAEAWDRHILDSLTLIPVIEAYAQLPPTPPPSVATSSGRTSSSSNSSSSSSSVGAPASPQPRSRPGQAVPFRSSSESGEQSGVMGAAGQSRSQHLSGTSDKSIPMEASTSGRQEGGNGLGEGVPSVSREVGSSGPEQGQRRQLEGLRVIDVGTGPGLPGMVLAIARPQWQVTLLDSLQKRCKFMDDAARHAGVTNVATVWCRAEEGGQRIELREVHDVAVARAVAEMRLLCELCLPFVRPGGVFIAAKGPSPQAEVAAAGKAAKLLGARGLEVQLVDSFSPEGQRTAVVVPKVQRTPLKYPRKPGVPAKNPL